MTVAIDAGILAAVLLPVPYSEPARAKLDSWIASDEVLLAPTLLNYELTSVFRKAVAQGALTTDEAAASVKKLRATGIRWVDPSDSLNRRALEWAEQLRDHVAYDAVYLAVAEAAGVELWTTDGRLAKGARRLGLEWVRLVWE